MLANLDVDNIPAEKEAKFKERIISNRLKRNIIKWTSKFSRNIGPVSLSLRNLLNFIYDKLNQLKSDYKKTFADKGRDSFEQKIEQLFNEAENFKKQENYDLAEKKYIEVIGLDSKNIEAFKQLGHLYLELKNCEEAKQTFQHILKLKIDDEDTYDHLAQIAKEKGNFRQAREDYLKSLKINKQNAQTYYNLATVNRAMGKLAEAAANLKKALNIEPNNPRFLDTMLETSIMLKDKIGALDAYGKLVEANPENQKIREFKKQINEL